MKIGAYRLGGRGEILKPSVIVQMVEAMAEKSN
jgi:hypothetical protein